MTGQDGLRGSGPYVWSGLSGFGVEGKQAEFGSPVGMLGFVVRVFGGGDAAAAVRVGCNAVLIVASGSGGWGRRFVWVQCVWGCI